MKIQYKSDLHMEFQENSRYLKNNELSDVFPMGQFFIDPIHYVFWTISVHILPYINIGHKDKDSTNPSSISPIFSQNSA